MNYCKSFEDLIDSLKKLPGVGYKSAERMAYQILDMNNFDVDEFSKSLHSAKTNIHRCNICGHLTEEDLCEACKDNSRDQSIICVVQSSKDVYAIDKTNSYHGLYHVLNGAISPVNGIGPNDLNIDSLINRIETNNIKEIIIATNPTVEGETTALYLSKILEKYNLEITRIAYGVPLGANLDYTDDFTIIKAIEGRRKI